MACGAPCKTLKTKSGDTMIEVLIALAIYSIIALFTITTMRVGIQEGESSLELTQARLAVSAQADAIRFIQNAFLAEREYALDTTYKNLWNEIAKKAVDASTSIPELAGSTCPAIPSSAFIINIRKIDPNTPSNTVSTSIIPATIYPRLVYQGVSGDPYTESDSSHLTLARAEGIWIIARKSARTASGTSSAFLNTPEYYDFHIYTCWLPPSSSQPSTTGTIIRLYNPALRESLR